MSTVYPISLDTFSVKTNAVDDVLDAHVNNLQDSMFAVETYVGKFGSGVSSSLTWLLTNVASSDPGHSHTSAFIASLAHTKLSFAGLTTGHALISSSPTAAGFRAIAETDIADGSVLARTASAETITGLWSISNILRLITDVASGGLKIEDVGGDALIIKATAGGGGITLHLPTSDGTTGQVLVTDGAGVLDWDTLAGTVPTGVDKELLYNNSGTWTADDFLQVETDGVSIRMGSNGARLKIGWVMVEETGLSGPFVDVAAFVPAGTFCLFVTGRVTALITGASSFNVGEIGVSNLYADSVAVANGTTWSGTSGQAMSAFWRQAATAVRLTANGGDFTAGSVRLVGFFFTVIPPTS